MTAAKNGVYSWAKKALPSCKRRAEVLSSCSDIKILWRSTGAYRVRYAPHIGRKVYSTENGRNIFHFNFRHLELNRLFGIHIPINSIIANRIAINVLLGIKDNTPVTIRVEPFKKRDAPKRERPDTPEH